MSDDARMRVLLSEEDLRVSPTPLVILRAVSRGFEVVKCFTMTDAECVYDERGAIGIYHNGQWVRRKRAEVQTDPNLR